MENLEVAMTTSFADLFDSVFASDWKAMELADAIAFRNTLEAYVAGANMLREKFDSDVWAGHSDGTVSIDIESIRKAAYRRCAWQKGCRIDGSRKAGKASVEVRQSFDTA